MKIEHEKRGGIDLLRLSGRLDSVSAPTLDAEIAACSAGEGTGLVIDFGEVDYISSAGLRVLLVGVRAYSTKPGPLIVAAASEDVRDVVTLTGFDKVLTLDESVDGALARAEA